MRKRASTRAFRNPNNTRLEGLYLFRFGKRCGKRHEPVHRRKAMKAEVLEATKAKQIYEDNCAQHARPGRCWNMSEKIWWQIRIFRLSANETRRVQFTYSQVLKRESGLCDYTLPLVPSNAAAQPIKELVVNGEIKSSIPIASLYSPTHKVDFTKKSDGKSAKFSMEANGKVPESHLKIFMTSAEKEVGTGFTAYRKDGDGYFMVVLSPQENLKDTAPMPKDVIFVLDTSGSMSGDKIKQAKKSLDYCLNALRDEDRFNVVRFSTETDVFAKELVQVSDKSKKDAQEFVKKFDAAGGTAIDAALQSALENKANSDKSRPTLIVFLTDGMPTVGETDGNKIAKVFGEKNEGRMRLFAFGVGNDVNAPLLDKLSSENGGVSD